MSTQLEDRIEELARRRVAFREVNEHIAKLNEDWRAAGTRLLVCECSVPECTETIEIAPAAYEQVRADGARFVVLPGHEMLEVERVVDRQGRFLVVEKLGTAAALARDADPRRHA